MMDESFVEVMKQYHRMCAAHTAGCLSCELAAMNNGNGIPCRDMIMKHPEDAERIVMKWAAEHPEPQYPAWRQWQKRMFPDYTVSMCPATLAKVPDCDNLTCDECRSKRIPAEIAEKLGIKPGKEWE